MKLEENLIHFSLSPVQPFIEAARTTRDLWSGSYLLSWLTAHAMATALKKNALERKAELSSDGFEKNPLVRFAKDRTFDPDKKHQLLYSCLPNTFTVSFKGTPEEARLLAEEMEKVVASTWEKIASEVRQYLEGQWSAKSHKDEDQPLFGWVHQVGNFWDIMTCVVPAGTDVAKAKSQFNLPDPPADSNEANHYGRELLGRLSGAQKMVRRIPNSADPKDTRPKCALFGTESAMGPIELEANREFWEGASRAYEYGERLQKRDRLGAVALTKRFAWSQSLAEKLDVEPSAKRSSDTATIAAAGWLSGLGWNEKREWFHEEIYRLKSLKSWSGQWLHWNRHDQDEDDPCDKQIFDMIRDKKRWAKEKLKSPPTYYAVLMMDGDHMGNLFRNSHDTNARKLSDALQTFALETVPGIIRNYLGDDALMDLQQPVYAGGDDVLAMLPLWMLEPGKGELSFEKTILDCAAEINEAFTQLNVEIPDGCEPLSTSAGLVIAHYKEDLREVLTAARKAEKAAKNSGRNCLCISAMRRSGEHAEAIIPWSQVDNLKKMMVKFAEGKLTDRWAYQLRPDLDSGALQHKDMVDQEVARLLSRSEERSDPDVFRIWQEFSALKKDETKAPDDSPEKKKAKQKKQIEKCVNALTLMMTASFMARGREN